jgi:hypothetical protein
LDEVDENVVVDIERFNELQVGSIRVEKVDGAVVEKGNDDDGGEEGSEKSSSGDSDDSEEEDELNGVA